MTEIEPGQAWQMGPHRTTVASLIEHEGSKFVVRTSPYGTFGLVVDSEAHFRKRWKPQAPEIVDVQTFDPWPFEALDVRLGGRFGYISTRGQHYPPPSSSRYDLSGGADNVLVTLSDGTEAVTSKAGVAAYRKGGE